MNPDRALNSPLTPAARACCLACGTPYPAGGEGMGCPVCLLQGALEAEPEAGNPRANAPLLPDGCCFHHYALVQCEDGAFEELGRGAMGVTYRAIDTVLGHAVALKTIAARVAAHPEARERFLREARAAARLRHPNIASVFYYGVRASDGQCFYTMELVEGETVEARLRRTGPLPAPLALQIVSQVARALRVAESQGLVHRDLKPANLVLTEKPELSVKVIDFGLAKAAASSPDESALTCGGFVGTPAFASPEQCAGRAVDARSDLYALGVTLWVMLTGQAPFRGNPAAVRQQHVDAPLPLEQLNRIPQPVRVLIEALLEKDPARRLQGPAALVQALSAVTAAVGAGRPLTLQALRHLASGGGGAVTRKPPTPKKGPEKVSLAHLPLTGTNLFGREADLACLDKLWPIRGSTS